MPISKIFLNAKYALIYIAPLFILTGCGKECYTSELQLKAEYERCSDLGTSFSGTIGKPVRTFVCTTSGNDMFADFIVRDGKLCRTYKNEY